MNYFEVSASTGILNENEQLMYRRWDKGCVFKFNKASWRMKF